MPMHSLPSRACRTSSSFIRAQLFDLAGLTCGHFGIAFWTFFGATFVGKAIIKVNIQSLFIIAVVKYGAALFDGLRNLMPAGAIRDLLKKFEDGFLAGQHAMCLREPDCRACCTANFNHLGYDNCLAMCDRGLAGADKAGGVVAAIMRQAWGLFLLGMIGYFVMTLINSAVQDRLAREVQIAAEEKATRKAAHAAHQAARDEGAGTPGGASGRARRPSTVAATKAAASAAASASAPTTPTHHVTLRGASVTAALVNVSDLFPALPTTPSPPASGRSPRSLLNKSWRIQAEREAAAAAKEQAAAAKAAAKAIAAAAQAKSKSAAAASPRRKAGHAAGSSAAARRSPSAGRGGARRSGRAARAPEKWTPARSASPAQTTRRR